MASLFAEALRCHQAGQLAEAVAWYDRVLSQEPDLAEAHNNRGVALAGLGRLGDAEIAYRRSLALDPQLADAYNNLGNALCEIGRLEDGERALRQAIGLKPDWARCHSNLGIALKSQGRLGEAEAAYRKALVLDPNFPEAYNNLGEVLLRGDSLREAEASLRHAIALNPHYAEAFCNLGNALQQEHRLEEAEAAYRQAIAFNPRFAAAHNNLGIVLFDLGRLEDAEKELRQAIALNPHYAEAFSNLGSTLKEQNRPCEAEAACRRAIALKPGHAQAHSNLGNALVNQNRLTEAVAEYRRAIAIDPSFASAYSNLGAALKYLGRLADARQAAEHATQLTRRNAAHFLTLSELKHFDAGDPHLASMEDLARNAKTLSAEEQIKLRFALAKAYEDTGQYENGFEQLLAGNALKRRQVAYDEASMLAAFERIGAVFTPELMRKFQNAGNPSSVPLFVVGMPRSGTTLIEQILASHPEVFGSGELPNFGRAVESLHLTGRGTLPFPDAMLDITSEDLQRLGTRYVAEITRLGPAAARIVNKMPSNFFFAGLIDLALPNARIIHVVRDPVDTCMSCFSKLFAAGQYQTYDLAELGRYYGHYQALMQHWHRVLPPGRILDVRYEDVVDDLEGQARRLIAHCGLAWDPRCLAFHETERPVCTASATQVRQPLYRHAIGRARPYERFLRPVLAELFGGENPVTRGAG